MRKCDTCTFHYGPTGPEHCRVAEDPFKFKGQTAPNPGNSGSCAYYCFYGMEPEKALALWGSGLQNRRDNSVLTQALEDITHRGESGSARRFIWSDYCSEVCDACGQKVERVRREALRRITWFGLRKLCHGQNEVRGYFDKYGPIKGAVGVALFLALQKWDMGYFMHNWTWPNEALNLVIDWLDCPGRKPKGMKI